MKVVAFHESIPEDKVVADANLKPYAVIKADMTATEAVELCKRLNWHIAEFGERYNLYIED